MSVKTLENLKEQTNKLTMEEKRQLARHLFESAGESNESDLSLSAESKEEKRKLWDKWMKTNREKYGGLYVALDGNKLLGTGKNYPEAAEYAKKAGVRDAFVDFLPPVGYVGEMGGW
ncbi:MAG: DUF5678 domain-containing protein [Aridibacter sp.]